MAEGKADLGGDLVKGGTIGGNHVEKVFTSFLDEPKDLVASENSIPLSPQWLYAKPNESKDTRQSNSLSYGTSSDAVHKDSWRLDGSQDKKEWRRNIPDIESSRRWREEERETGLLGRRERKKEGERETEYRKNDRRSESSSTKESTDSRPLTASDRWHEVTGRNSAHEGRRDSKWSSRWGPEDKDKEPRAERKMDIDKEDQNAEKQSFSGNNRSLAESDSRDKWRPRHRQEINSGASSVYRAAPGFGFERGRGEGPNVGFAPGRGRANFIGGLPFSRPASTSPIGAATVNSSDTLHGKSGLSVVTFRYPRGKLLDIYRKQRTMPTFGQAPEGLEDAPQITQLISIEPLAFVTPSDEEGALLDDISKGKTMNSDISYNTTSKDMRGRASVSDIDVGNSTVVENEEKSFTSSAGCGANKDSNLWDEPSYRPGKLFSASSTGEGYELGTVVKTEVVLGEGVHNYNRVTSSDLTHFDAQVIGKNAVNEDGQSGFCDSLAKLEGNITFPYLDVDTRIPDGSPSLFDVPFTPEVASNAAKYLSNSVGGKNSYSIVPPDEMSLFYRDPQGEIQGPFLGVDIISWLEQGFFGMDLPVCLSDAPEGTPFQPLGELIPQLKLNSAPTSVQGPDEQSEHLDIVRGNLEVDRRASDFIGSFASSDKRWTPLVSDGTLDTHIQPQTELKESVDPLYGWLPASKSENSVVFTGAELHDFAGQDVEEVLYTGRRPSSLENPLGKLVNDLQELSLNPGGHQFLAKDKVQPKSSSHIPADNDLNPLGLLLSELEGTHPKHPLSSNIANVSDHRPIMNAIGGGGSSFNSIGDPSVVRDAWPSNYMRSSSSNVLHDSIDASSLTLFEQEANRISLEERLLEQQLQKQQQQIQQQIQQQQIQQQQLSSGLNMHSSRPFFEQVKGSLHHQQSMNQSMPELEHFVKLQLQEQHHLQQLQQQQRLQQQEQLRRQQLQHQMLLIQQQQQQQQEQLLFEHLLQQQLHDPCYAASHVDQVLYKQQLLRELQQQAHHVPRHHEPSIEDLIQAKFGQNLHPEHHSELLEQLLRLGLHPDQFSNPRHRNLLSVEQQLLLDLYQEQLQAQQFPLALRQQRGTEKKRNVGGVWSVDESGQFIRTASGSNQVHSGRLGQQDFVQPLQSPSSYEQLSQLERKFMLHERSQRGNYEANSQVFDRTASISAGTPGPDVDIVNALARLHGLEVQDLHSQMYPSVQREHFPSGSAHQLRVPSQFTPSHLDAVENNWSEHNGLLSNSFTDSHLNQLHLQAETKKRDMNVNLMVSDSSSWASLAGKDERPSQGWTSLRVNDENINRGLDDLLQCNMALDSSQSLNPGEAALTRYDNRDPSWPFSNHASDRSFNSNADKAGLADSFKDASVYNTAAPVQQDHLIADLDRYDSSGRLASRSNSVAFFDNRLFPDMDESDKEHLTDSLRLDASIDWGFFSNLKDGKMVKKHGSKRKLSKSVLDDLDSGIDLSGASIIDQSNLEVNVPVRHVSLVSTGGDANFYNFDMGAENSYSVDLVNHKVTGILSRGADAAATLKLSSHGTGPELVTAPPSIKGKTSTSEGRRREAGGGNNPSEGTTTVTNKKDNNRFRQTSSSSSSSSSDAREASFIDMLKSTKKMVPPPESEAFTESSDGGGKGSNNKKKGKKGRHIDPSLLGFKVHSNRIMMGEIQRPDD